MKQPQWALNAGNGSQPQTTGASANQPQASQAVVSQAIPSALATRAHAPAKEIRTSVNKQARLLFYYLVVMQLIGPAVALVYVMLIQGMHHHAISVDTALAELDGTYLGFQNLACVAVAFVFWVFTHRSEIADPTTQGIFHRREHQMTAVVFLGAVALLFTGQSISTIYDMGFTWVINQLGLKATTSSEVIDAASGTFAMFFYVAFFGPVVEEIIFRGVIMNALKRYGKVFAIITSAAMFGFFHSDLSQGLFAFFVGLVLGYVACEYSIFWSILLHITNNLIISNIGTVLISHLSTQAQNWVNLFMLVVGILLGILVLYLGRARITSFIDNNRAYKGIYASWAGLWFLIYIALQIAMTVLEFVPMR